MNRPVFRELIRSAVQEICARSPSYFSHCEVDAPPFCTLIEMFRTVPSCQPFTNAELELAIVRGLQTLDDFGVATNLGCRKSDRISMLLLRSIADAYAASSAWRTLVPRPMQSESFVELFSRSYALAETRKRTFYTRATREGRTLLLVSATGVPLSVWGNLLFDDEINRHCVVVQSRAGPLMEGGTVRTSTITADAEDICDVLESDGSDVLDIVAWCNGARTAIAVAGALPHRVSSLTLISPTFHGSVDATRYPSPFEETLPLMYELMQQDPARADDLIGRLTSADLDERAVLLADAAKRADAVLQMPPKHFVRDLLLPLASPESFGNYLARVSSDNAYDMQHAVTQIRCRTTLITGTHDTAVNCDAAREVLTKCGREVVHVVVEGGGHHMQLLQYSYLGYVLRSVLEDAPPMEMCRLAISSCANSASASSSECAA